MIGITILGATGTIGINTLDVIARHKERYRVVALTANRDHGRMFELCGIWRPEYAVMADPDAAEQLDRRLRQAEIPVRVLSGVEGLERVSSLDGVDCVMAAIVGAAGLLPTLAAAKTGKRILLANKEALVMSGDLFMEEVKRHDAELLPIDSEHNAVFQCLPNGCREDLSDHGVRRILLTSSGGPFRRFALSELADVTPDQACAHPNWVMGRKISVDSATMMNKGLEVIEACHLFDLAHDDIQIVVHPQSIIHSMVEYVDGSVLAQMASPDMRVPIAHALAWPERVVSGAQRLDLFSVATLNFEPPDRERFPCIQYAYDAVEAGGTAPAVLNAANEVAVEAFLDGRLPFTGIPRIIHDVMGEVRSVPAADLGTVLAADRDARTVAADMVRR
ncbi:MAG: 1-deoxy-D-xylulose-5-phosphate reductoisomerase [Gammaproteobacteria bacterium]|nr:1-deoxy-D-xylulose-5-phosphate reductoisomerase [Gammaproteobacteria bacterium]